MKDGTNPKDLIGVTKVSLTCVPAVAILHEAHAMMDGAEKYGPYNWRDNAVQARIYIDACKRHIDAWLEGEECASDSGAHHLGHARACLGILLDAQALGNLVDNRPPKSPYPEVLARLNGAVKQKRDKGTGRT
jgi:hypothetical protein